MISTGKYKAFLTIPEAALVWSDLPLELLAEAAYAAPGVPVIVGHPDVTARAEALIEATDFGTLMECGRPDPDMPLPSPERRKVARQALLAWIERYWPDEHPSRKHAPLCRPAELMGEPFSPTPTPAEPDRLLTEREVLALLGISRSTFARRRTAGELPAPTHANPNRWPLSIIQRHITDPDI